MKAATAASAIVVLALAAAACDVKVDEKGEIDLGISQGRARDEWTRSYTIAPGGVLEISNEFGPIEAEAGSGAQVEVVVAREARAKSDEEAQARLKELEIVETVAADRVRLIDFQSILDHLNSHESLPNQHVQGVRILRLED